MRLRFACSLLLSACLWVGCSRPSPTAPSSAAVTQPAPTGRPQPKLAVIKLWLGPKEVLAEQALAHDQIETGMMFRKEMGEDEGMLFVFGRPIKATFWMRNTLLPLSCAYIDSTGIVLE